MVPGSETETETTDVEEKNGQGTRFGYATTLVHTTGVCDIEPIPKSEEVKSS